MKTLPFNFERIDDSKVFVSNIGGFFEIIDSENLGNLVESPSEIPNSVQGILSSKLFISSSSDFEVKRVALASAYAKRLTSELQFRPAFLFVPTLRCDHTCSYCQVARAPIEQTEYDMSEEHLDLAFERMLKIGKPPYSIEIQGGEPLLRLDLIQRLYEHCDKHLKRDEFSIVIASSLSLISEEVIEWAKTRNIEFSMSLDGVANIHDKNRILATDSSHARALSGAIKIIEELGLNRLGTVTTITKEALNDPEGLINAHDNLGINSLFVRPLSPYGFARKKGMGSYSLKEYFIYYRQVLNGLKLRWEREELFTEHSMGVHVKRLLQPNFNAYADLKSPSGFALNTILFNFDGNIFGSDEARMLQRVHPEIDFSLGHVMDDTLNVSALSRAVIAGGINIDKPGCNTCAYQPFCGADPMQNISLFGEATGHKAQSPFCEYHKTMFSIAIEYLNGSQSDAQFIRDLSK